MLDLVAFNTAFAGAFAGTVTAFVFVWAVRCGERFKNTRDVPAWVWFATAFPLLLAGFAMMSALA